MAKNNNCKTKWDIKKQLQKEFFIKKAFKNSSLTEKKNWITNFDSIKNNYVLKNDVSQNGTVQQNLTEQNKKWHAKLNRYLKCLEIWKKIWKKKKNF